MTAVVKVDAGAEGEERSGWPGRTLVALEDARGGLGQQVQSRDEEGGLEEGGLGGSWEEGATAVGLDERWARAVVGEALPCSIVVGFSLNSSLFAVFGSFGVLLPQPVHSSARRCVPGFLSSRAPNDSGSVQTRWAGGGILLDSEARNEIEVKRGPHSVRYATVLGRVEEWS